MIVTCPNCQTRYNLPDDKVPAGGAKVKCSKCAQVFKAEHPPVAPEEEFEALLEEESQGGDAPSDDAFEDAFDDVAAAAGAKKDEPEPAAPEESVDEPVADESAAKDESTDDSLEDDLFEDEEGDDDLFEDETDPADEVVEEMPDTDDLFDDAEETLPEPEEGAKPTTVEPGKSDSEEDALFAGLGDDEDDDSDDLFSDDDDDDLFADDDDDDEEELDEEEEDSFGEDLGLDEEAPKKKGGKSLGCLIILLVALLGLGAAIYFKVWTYAGIDLADSLKNVPFVGQLFMEEDGGDEEVPPGESPAERVRKIELKNVKQYYVSNDKLGNLFVVEGKAVNKFNDPKERIKVEVILYDDTNNVLTSQAFLCGNVLSQFQLQVQTEKEIKDGLGSEVGVLSNNTFIRPGASTPFMAVFFSPPAGVKEFMVKVVDVGDSE